MLAVAQLPMADEVTAVFVDEAPRIDGYLHDAVWNTVEPVDEFTQIWPDDGSQPTEASEVRIAYDRDNLYFAFRFWDQNPELIRAKNLERGGRNDRDDHAYIALDTYVDGRNAYLFEVNALGTQDDATITDEGLTIDSFSWNAVFRSETVIDSLGWTMEVSIPFRQLRFPKGEDLTFGLMISRMINRKNERVIWPHIGLDFAAGSNTGSFGALAAVSQYGRLHGLKNIRRGKNIEIKPYVISGIQEIRSDLAFDVVERDFTRDLGVDFKYGITSNLTLDLSVNTDFAQVEADNVQLNLTRFNLFFPEKREFFLERSGLFEHGNARSTQTFFSRRIGLSRRILAGGRLTGQVGRFSLGLLNIETGDEMGDLLGSKSINNTVARIRAEVFERATVGAIFTGFQSSTRENYATGVDAQYRFWTASEFNAWFATVSDSNDDKNREAGHVSLRIQNDRYGGQASFTSVGRDYSPALGFVRRHDMREWAVAAQYTPVVDIAWWPAVNRLSFRSELSYVEGQDGRKQSMEADASAGVAFNRRDGVSLTLTRQFERLERSFFIRPNVEIPSGDYTFSEFGVMGRTDSSRRLYGMFGVSTGQFYHGTRHDMWGQGGFRQSQYLQLEGGVNHSIIDLPVDNGRFGATTLTASILTAVSRKLFAKALIQYDNFTRDLQTNIRIDWIHTPGSDLFLVFNTAHHFAGDHEMLFDPRRDVLFRDRLGVAKLTYLILL